MKTEIKKDTIIFTPDTFLDSYRLGQISEKVGVCSMGIKNGELDCLSVSLNRIINVITGMDLG